MSIYFAAHRPTPGSLLYRLGPQDHCDLDTQAGRVVDRSLPDKRPIDAEVLVNQEVSQPHDVRPWYGVVPRRNFRGQPRDRAAKSLVGQEFGFRLAGDGFRRCRSRRIDQAGLVQYGGPDEWLQCGLDREVHPAAEQGSEFSHHCRYTEQPRAGATQEINEEIDIAVRPHLTRAAEPKRDNSPNLPSCSTGGLSFLWRSLQRCATVGEISNRLRTVFGEYRAEGQPGGAC